MNCGSVTRAIRALIDTKDIPKLRGDKGLGASKCPLELSSRGGRTRRKKGGMPAEADMESLLNDKFSEWNLRLLRGFFSEASRGEEVFLRVDKGLLDQLGQDIGGDKGFLQAVRQGPAWAKPLDSMVERTESLVKQRRYPSERQWVEYKDPGDIDLDYRGTRAPTYLPYLAALVRNDSEHSTAYYDGLSDDLKLKHAFGSIEMQRMEQAWVDLEKWTNDLGGRFGFFKLRKLGGYSRIGVPRSQSILQHKDVNELVNAFLQAEVRAGHEITEQEITRVLNEVKASRWSYSAAFQSALEKEVFKQPIRAAISAAYADWDGTIPAKIKINQEQGTPGTSSVSSESGLRLCLAVIKQEPLTLAPLWWVPALQDTGHFRLTQGEIDWDGNFSGTEGSACARNPDRYGSTWEVAKQAYSGPVQFRIECFADSDAEPTTAEVLLPERQLWILVPAFDGSSGDIELREGGLPGNGSAYLLAPPKNSNRLRGYLEREQPGHSIVLAEGLPPDWLLVCLPDCATLKDDQRLLPDGDKGSHPPPRAIRFVGGRSVTRGYSRMYLPYDLPTIELDAPQGTQLKCPDGLRLEEDRAPIRNDADSGGNFLPRKRYRIELASSSSAAYLIQAVLNGKLLAQAKLRTAGLGGELVDTGQPFSLDNQGRATSSREGLSGVLSQPIESDSVPILTKEDLFELPITSIGSPSGQNPHPCGAREWFLDSLAQSGSINYGVARDQILRLFHDTGEKVDPPLILLELRSRGHLEISTTHKGYMSRIHAVEPTVFELPISSVGKRAYGVTGTLRLSHWELIENETSAWFAYRVVGRRQRFQPLRLLSDDEELVQLACEIYGLRFAKDPAVAIANWSADIANVRKEVFSNCMESIGSTQDDATRFNADRGVFTARPAGNAIELWKIRDLDIGMDNLYVLSDRGGFAFIRDSRWGIWIALDAFAQWVERNLPINGVHPIPITYETNGGTLWLPARISLPNILERALVLCSGDSPEVIVIQHKADMSSNDRIALSTREGWPSVVSVNCFYSDMAKGRWLAYHWVPRPVASLVAEKLGATLDII